jgi:hypothetical protein
MSEIQEDIHITEVIIQDMYDIDGSADRRYLARINGLRTIYETDGLVRGHMSHIEWILFALDSYLYMKKENTQEKLTEGGVPQCKPGTGKTVVYDPRTGKTYTPENQGGDK